MLFLGSLYLMVPSLYIRSILFFSSFIEGELPLAFHMVMFPWNATSQKVTESLSIMPYHSRERKTCHGQDYDVILLFKIAKN